jgi:hypothetical protein
MGPPMSDAHDPDDGAREELRLDEQGIWLVRSLSATVYRLDLDRQMLRREPGPGSSRGDFDNEYVPLVRVEVAADGHLVPTSSIRVGRRHLYLTDPYGGTQGYRWWLQRMAERIERAPQEDEPAPPVVRPRGSGWTGTPRRTR